MRYLTDQRFFQASTYTFTRRTPIDNVRIGTALGRFRNEHESHPVEVCSFCLRFLHVFRTQQCIPCIPRLVDVVQQPPCNDWTPNDLNIVGPLRHELTRDPHARHRRSDLHTHQPEPSPGARYSWLLLIDGGVVHSTLTSSMADPRLVYENADRCVRWPQTECAVVSSGPRLFYVLQNRPKTDILSSRWLLDDNIQWTGVLCHKRLRRDFHNMNQETNVSDFPRATRKGYDPGH